MVKKWDLIYDLRGDKAAIESGSIERHIVEGTITEAKPTSMPIGKSSECAPTTALS
jgi:hypothetical protein